MAASVAPEEMPTSMPSSVAQRRAIFARGLGIDLQHAVEQRGVEVLRDEAGTDALDRGAGWPPEITGEATGSTANTCSFGHFFLSTRATPAAVAGAQCR